MINPTAMMMQFAAQDERIAAQAARIAEMEAEVARLREALSAIGDAGYVQPKDAPLLHGEAVDIARAALAAPDTGGADAHRD